MIKEPLSNSPKSDFITFVYEVFITSLDLAKRGMYQGGCLFNRLKKIELKMFTTSEDLSKLGDKYKLESQNRTKR